ncbi:MAG: hypothetical protein GW795_11575 [Cyanobacteria bacterium]|nr:hypothetical protein [Cyanobacteria bacterium CG_2015-16_32_12]NCO77134.1 hypothetical protein [Cyanobacteria bacterium CG_2015-22_32_23]NCQ05303.1 hypothetical protein [Cyanobacteria bacterium CG_2015-09_32_10]NCQ42492.1 hypothetical protein [Cyanobacteria bacterium CG_2015-04_32_10]NCS84896.1 hypothetical protein [Cyanobacteria bacterium CG_2015-02_32_10]
MPFHFPSQFDRVQRKLIGEILVEAGLISSAQLKVVLSDQSQFFKFKIGEILALRGWLKKETVDFLVDICIENNLTKYESKPIGYYFQRASLLTEIQINTILKEQKQLGLKFCHLAVIKGFFSQQTADFFLENIAKKFQEDQTKTLIIDLSTNIYEKETVIGDYTSYESVKEKETVILTPEKYTESDSDTIIIYDPEIQYSPSWIDF